MSNNKNNNILMNAIRAEDLGNFETHQQILDEDIDLRYTNSRFQKLKGLGPRTKGMYGERYLEELMTKEGIKCIGPDNTDHDRIIFVDIPQLGLKGRIKVEVKMSFLWKGTDHGRFQQIRQGQDYDIIVFIMVYPEAMEFFMATKAMIQKQNLPNQHGGKKAKSGTICIDCDPRKVSWMIPLEVFPHPES